jgi:hypothetical protein
VRRLARILLNSLTLVSLLLFTATVVLWVRNHRVADVVEWSRWRLDGETERQTGVSLASAAGGMAVSAFGSRLRVGDPAERARIARELAGHRSWAWKTWPRPLYPVGSDNPSGLNRLGFYGWSRSQSGPWGWRRDVVIAVPNWAMLVTSAGLPAFWCYRRGRAMRLRRRRAGMCPSCGYDLRATPERCPECGRTDEISEAHSTNKPATAAAEETV